MNRSCDVLVIGGGPAGLAAAVSAHKQGAHTVLVEREERLGGLLKQCVHDGFGLLRFSEKLSGPEYAERCMEEFYALGIEAQTSAFVTRMTPVDGGFTAACISRFGVTELSAKALVLATGCRERTAKQVRIHGTRPAGILTAGTAQHLVNLLGQLPTKRCVILGSGDIGLIMARRLTLEGATVLGVYEAKPAPSGLKRNLAQCLDDFGIPLLLSQTVTRAFGETRLTGVEICRVDSTLQPICGTEERLDCDGLILSVGLIPENELAVKLSVPLDPRTGGPICDERMMTRVPGVFACGNCYTVYNLVDYVSENGELAGTSAAQYAQEKAN